MDIGKIHPTAYNLMVKVDQDVTAALSAAAVQPLVADLVRIRVSQINGCAFCLRLHTRDALAMGETTDRLAVLAAWWESQYFTGQERAALALAEQVTSLTVRESRTWDDGTLTQEQASAVAWLATTMNAWNRIAITSHYPVGP
jgi:AhpD family alkylhydroperoxidase